MRYTRLSLAEQLEQVLAGNASLGEILAEVWRFEGDLIGCFYGLHHFAADDDIREKDAEYKLMQESEMQKLIALLRGGASQTTLEKVHFLGVSNA